MPVRQGKPSDAKVKSCRTRLGLLDDDQSLKVTAMFLWRTHPKLSVSVIAAIAAAIGWSWWSSRPLAQVSLPDGSRLVLFRITPADEYRYSVPAPPNAGIWAKLWHAFGMEKATMPATSNIGFYFRHYPNGESGGFPRLSTCDGHAQHSSNVCDSMVPWTPAAFPRRGKSFQVRVYTRGPDPSRAAETILDIPNPFAETKFPVWVADPFPSQVRVGELPVTVEGWTYFPERDLLKSHNRSARWRIFRDAESSHAPALVMNSPTRPDLDIVCVQRHLSDATGNVAFDGLPYSESAWRVHAIIEYGRCAPITPGHWIPLGRLTVPDSTDRTSVTISDALSRHRVESVRLNGSREVPFAENDGKGAALILNYSSPNGEPHETRRRKRPYARIVSGRCRKIGESEWAPISADRPLLSHFPMGPVSMNLPEQYVPGTEFELELLRSEVVFQDILVPPPTPLEIPRG
jgi:hypothetical protein